MFKDLNNIALLSSPLHCYLAHVPSHVSLLLQVKTVIREMSGCGLDKIKYSVG